MKPYIMYVSDSDIEKIHREIRNHLLYAGNENHIFFAEYKWNPFSCIRSFFQNNLMYVYSNTQMQIEKRIYKITFRDITSGLFLFLFKMKIMHSCGFFFSQRYTLVYSYALNSFYVLKKHITNSVIYEEENVNWFFDLYIEMIHVYLLDDLFRDFIDFYKSKQRWVLSDDITYTIYDFYKRVPEKYKSEICIELFSCADMKDEFTLYERNIKI